jgi:hypothetical protein
VTEAMLISGLVWREVLRPMCEAMRCMGFAVLLHFTCGTTGSADCSQNSANKSSKRKKKGLWKRTKHLPSISIPFLIFPFSLADKQAASRRLRPRLLKQQTTFALRKLQPHRRSRRQLPRLPWVVAPSARKIKQVPPKSLAAGVRSDHRKKGEEVRERKKNCQIVGGRRWLTKLQDVSKIKTDQQAFFHSQGAGSFSNSTLNGNRELS